MDEKELFEAALTDEAPVVETPETPVEQPQEQPWDEHGRFAAKATEPEQPEAPAASPQAPPKDEAHVPSWRLREVREEAERRLAEERANWQRQVEMLQRQSQPKAEPQATPDPWENPQGFRDHGVKQAIDPIQQRVQAITEFQSRQFAVSRHGEEKVVDAEKAFEVAVRSGDPEAGMVLQRAMQSLDPSGDILRWHQQRSVYQQIGGDPNAWFEKELERRMADQQFAGSIMQKIQQGVRQNPQAQQQIHVPPSLNRVSAARSASDDDTDASDAAMFRYAMR